MSVSKATNSVAVALCLAAVGAVAGCAWLKGGGDAPGEGERSFVNLALAGRAEAGRISPHSLPMMGPGSEGRTGDFYLQNAFVRFVVGAADRFDPAPECAGALLDAAVHNCEDYMRLLTPQVGEGQPPTFVCEEVSVAEPDSDIGPASVVAAGRWSNNSDVFVRTVYRLKPASHGLEISTSIENRSGEALVDLDVGDLVYHGRTERFVEGLGLHPAGKSARTRWLSFFGGGCVWGLWAADGEPIECHHGDGYSKVSYGRFTLAPGQTRTYQRVFAVERGHPDRVGARPRGLTVAPMGDLAFRVTEKETGVPVEGAYVTLSSLERGPAALVVTDEGGRGSLQLAGGEYVLTCRAAGRSPFECRITIAGNSSHRMDFGLGAPTGVRVRVEDSTDGFVRPTCARLTILPLTPGTPEPHNGPLFSGLGPGRVVLVPPLGELFMPLALARGSALSTYRIVASKGPLYGIGSAEVTVTPGRTTEATIALRRAVDAGDRAAIDFGQFADTSPESALTMDERALLNSCEGLDGVVLIRRATDGAAVRSEGSGPPAITALGLTTDRTGRLTVLPGYGAGPPGAVHPGTEPEQVFALLRAQFPGSLIQLEDPLSESVGYFKLAGYRPDGPAAQPLSRHFDAIRLLAGRNTLTARRMLPYWFALLNGGRSVIVTGGSDTSCAADTASLGARTYVHLPHGHVAPRSRDIRDAILSLRETPNAFVSNGPFLR